MVLPGVVGAGDGVLVGSCGTREARVYDNDSGSLPPSLVVFLTTTMILLIAAPSLPSNPTTINTTH